MSPLLRHKLQRMVLLLCIALLLFLVGLSSMAVEYFYSDRVYQFLSVLQRIISNWVPFSLGDFLYALLFIYCLVSVVTVLKKIKKEPLITVAVCSVLAQVLNFSLILYIGFKILWGLNYSRPSISTRLGIGNERYTTKDLLSLGNFLVQKINTIEKQRNKHKRQYTVVELRKQTKIAYDKLALVNPFFVYKHPSLKPVTFNWLISTIGIEGYYSPLSGEANVNMRLPYMELPFVASHETSHTLGIAREDEANLIGYLVSINSPDNNFKYSGYYTILRSVLFEIRMKAPEDYSILLNKINAGTLADFNEERVFWQKFNGDLSAYMSTILDKFLKANNQKKGMDSYQDIVLWVYNLHKQEIKAENKLSF